MNNWNKYYNRRKEIRPQTIRAVSLCKNKKKALDLGCGEFIESKYLSKHFNTVVSIDSAELSKYAKNLPKNFLFMNIDFDDEFFNKNTFNLINAQYALPFYGKKNFNKYFKNLRNILKPNGIIAGQLFGVKDSWNKPNSNLIFHNKAQVLHLLKGMKLIEFIEEEKEASSSVDKLKHWHIFHFIVKK